MRNRHSRSQCCDAFSIRYYSRPATIAIESGARSIRSHIIESALINAVATGDGIELEFQANEIRERLRLPRTIQHREDNTGRVNENGRE